MVSAGTACLGPTAQVMQSGSFVTISNTQSTLSGNLTLKNNHLDRHGQLRQPRQGGDRRHAGHLQAGWDDQLAAAPRRARRPASTGGYPDAAGPRLSQRRVRHRALVDVPGDEDDAQRPELAGQGRNQHAARRAHVPQGHARRNGELQLRRHAHRGRDDFRPGDHADADPTAGPDRRAGADGLVAAAGRANLLLIGLSERWRKEGLGATRQPIARTAPAPILFVRCGERPGALAPATDVTTFGWSSAGIGVPRAFSRGFSHAFTPPTGLGSLAQSAPGPDAE